MTLCDIKPTTRLIKMYNDIDSDRSLIPNIYTLSSLEYSNHSGNINKMFIAHM